MWILTALSACAVANVYFSQPLLDTIAEALHTSSGYAGLAGAGAQIGYAAGLLFIVPLGDRVAPRTLITTLGVVTVAALVAVAAAPSIAVLAAALAIVGLTTVVAQVVVPLAMALAHEGTRGRVLATINSGVLIGVLLARTLSGGLAAVAGWRAVYVAAALLTAGLAVTARRALREPAARARAPHAGVARPDTGYRVLLGSMVRLVVTRPVLRLRIATAALVYVCFFGFWATMAFLLAGPHYRFDEGTIGLFGLVAFVGVAATRVAGRFADRGDRPAQQATAGFLLLMVVAYLPLFLASSSLAALITGVVLLDIGVMGATQLGQHLVVTLTDDASSRINGVYVGATYLVGAGGAALAAVVFDLGGWSAVCGLGVAAAALALATAVVDLARYDGNITRAVRATPPGCPT